VLARFAAIRRAAAPVVGLPPDSDIPTPVSVTEPKDYTNYMTGELVPAASVNFVARRVVATPPRIHKAFAGTGAVCAAVAARLPGTIVSEVTRLEGDPATIMIGHPTGVFPIRVAVSNGQVAEASFGRTARRIMEGTVYVRESQLPSL
jgi:2-methylaconitate cis-trans-isomerase PrpF